MSLDNATLVLFGRTPREIGNPYRHKINSAEELENFVSSSSGVTDCFVSVYPNNFLIDKLFFDIEYGPKPLEDAQDMFSWMISKGYEVVPIASGNPKRPGYHLHMKTKPKLYGPLTKVLLTKAGFNIIESVFGDFTLERTRIDNKMVRILRNKDRILGPDPTCLGDIRRLCRIPNTLRPPQNVSWCTFLDPDEFLSMSQPDVYKHIKHQHIYEHSLRNNGYGPELTDFPFDLDKLTNYNGDTDWEPLITPSGSSKIPSNPNLFLEGILRPCLYKHIININPTDEIRVATTLDLLTMGYSAEFITTIFSTLGWRDFDTNITLKKVVAFEKKVKNGYKPYSCTRLRTLCIPRQCCVG